MVKCDAADCDKEAVVIIKCDGLVTKVCDACLIVHASHSTTFKMVENLVERDWLKVKPVVNIVPLK